LNNLLRNKLVHHDSKIYEGYFFTYLGYDFLALKTFLNRNKIESIGRQIGVGKESDIYIAKNEEEEEIVLKLQRLGRVSFRQIKNKRDYLKKKKTSWLFVSRIGALKEFSFMKALYDEKFPVPYPIDWNRHCILMSKVDGYLLVNIKEMGDVEKVFKQCLDCIIRFAQYGLIHGDFNEFNILVSEEENITVIDFPQMISTSHKNAEIYFDRDVNCIFTFFEKRFNYKILKKNQNYQISLKKKTWTKKFMHLALQNNLILY